MHKRNLYQTHLTEGQWSYINKEFLENDSRKRKYSLQSVFEAILYLLAGGCQWRRLPHDCPKWKSVYYYYHKWRMEGRMEHFMADFCLLTGIKTKYKSHIITVYE